MNFDEILYTNVLVVGTGIAGTCAALSAAEQLNAAAKNNSRAKIIPQKTPVTLASAGALFSGSSFFEGTWGLGLVAPESPSDEEDFVQTILEVGCGAAQEDLVRSFVTGIRPAISQLESWGVTLKHAGSSAADQKEYIPCFDHKHRAWHGIEREPYVQAIGQRLKDAQVRICEGLELLDVVDMSENSPLAPLKEELSAADMPLAPLERELAAAETPLAPLKRGLAAADMPLAPLKGELSSASETEGSSAKNALCALFYNAQKEAFTLICFDALVLATGGTGTLYSRHLTSEDNTGTTLALASELGCELTNLEFIQFMPGIVSPVSNIVFNEKTFRFMALPEEVAKDLGGEAKSHKLLEQRSGYGPFTSRLASGALDMAIAQAGPEGLSFTPVFPADSQLPEFVRTYQTWLENEVGVTAQTPLRVAHYAHANNGGILINEFSATSIPGIFAAGECTGGMHGADRIGGLSSANGLVFGLRAGKNAAEYALQHNGSSAGDLSQMKMIGPASEANPAGIDAQLQCIMDRYASVVRSMEGLQKAQEELQELANRLLQCSSDGTPDTPAQIAAARRSELRIKTAQLLVNAMLSRSTSCGSHYLVP